MQNNTNTAPVKLTDFFGGSYLKIADLEADGPMQLTIKSIDVREFEDGQRKLVVTFEESVKGLVLNSTNSAALFDITRSSALSDAIGITVELYNDPNVSYAGKRCGGIRLKAAANATAPF